MRFFLTTALFCAAAFAAEVPIIVFEAHQAVIAGDLRTAKLTLKQYRATMGVTPEYIEALSWLGRGELNARDFHAAEENASEVRKLCLDRLATRKLDADTRLPTALGASIEVQAQAATAQGQRAEAVQFLRAELVRWHATSIRARIQKNLNLLTLEGKPAPALQTAHWLEGHKAQAIAAHRPHPVLLFFWAHWCSDCKQEIAVIRKLQQTYGPRGLVVVAPTQHYGYVAGGKEASPEVETKYITDVFAQFYAALGSVEVPVSEENFANYGVSTTPTLVLLDGQGIVRLYNPGRLTYDQLSARIEPLLRAPSLSASR
jgi:thiol-disulfide isomerase/thioredoxin